MNTLKNHLEIIAMELKAMPDQVEVEKKQMRRIRKIITLVLTEVQVQVRKELGLLLATTVLILLQILQSY